VIYYNSGQMMTQSHNCKRNWKN